MFSHMTIHQSTFIFLRTYYVFIDIQDAQEGGKSVVLGTADIVLHLSFTCSFLPSLSAEIVPSIDLYCLAMESLVLGIQ